MTIGAAAASRSSRHDLAELGVKTAMKEYFEHGTTDFYTLLTKLRAAKPTASSSPPRPRTARSWSSRSKELGLNTKVFGVGSWATADFIKLTGDAAEGIYAAVPYASSMPTRQATKAFVKNYQRAYKSKPGKYGAAGYNALEHR